MRLAGGRPAAGRAGRCAGCCGFLAEGGPLTLRDAAARRAPPSRWSSSSPASAPPGPVAPTSGRTSSPTRCSGPTPRRWWWPGWSSTGRASRAAATVRPVAPLRASPSAASASGSDGAGRWLGCGLCGTEWQTNRIRCPACGETDPHRLPGWQSDTYPAARVEACDTCHRYVKSVDLTVDGRAVPEVDELRSLWASTSGPSSAGTCGSSPGWPASSRRLSPAAECRRCPSRRGREQLRPGRGQRLLRPAEEPAVAAVVAARAGRLHPHQRARALGAAGGQLPRGERHPALPGADGHPLQRNDHGAR